MKKIILFSFLFFQLSGIAQSKQKWLFEADNFYAIEDYHNALLLYKKVLDDTLSKDFKVLPYEIQLTNQKLKNSKIEDNDKLVPLRDYVNHQIAFSYLKTFDYQKAEEHLAETSKSEYYKDDSYYLARTQMNVKNYEAAISTFEEYIRSENGNDSLTRNAQLGLKGCFLALEKPTSETVVFKADSVFNTGTSSFAVSYFGSENRVMFTSARPNGVILEPTQKSEYICDVYWTEKTTDGGWKPAINFGRPMNSAINDAASAVNNNNVIYYTRWNDETARTQSIYLARMSNFKFFEAFILDERVNKTGYKSMQPFVSMDGRTLYFSSNMPGGKGGFDIWKISLDSLGNLVGDSKNLDFPVNSEADEVTPFFHEASSTLFFSSNGSNSIGGLDVFKSLLNEDSTNFSIPVNMGIPVNSSYDDAYLVYDTQLKKGFLSSDREPCSDGHCYDIYIVDNEPIKITLEGVAYSLVDDLPLPNTRLTFKDVDGVFKNFIIETDQNGFYSTELTQGQEIFIKAQKEKYFADAAVVNTRKITQSTKLTQDFYLNSIPPTEIEIAGIEYDFNSDKLRPASLIELNKIHDFLELNNNLEVAINSHTDARGSDTYNQKLSQRRAQSCVVYLISTGIAKERITANGFGEQQPMILLGDDKKPVLDENGAQILLTEEYINQQATEERKEELHQLNRRTSFKVTGENFELKSK